MIGVTLFQIFIELLRRTASSADVRYPAESKLTLAGTLSNKQSL